MLAIILAQERPSLHVESPPKIRDTALANISAPEEDERA